MTNTNNSKSFGWMLAEWLTLGGMLLGSFYFLHTDMQILKTQLMSHEQATNQRMLSHEQRTDRLYEMFIELVKEKHPNS